MQLTILKGIVLFMVLLHTVSAMDDQLFDDVDVDYAYYDDTNDADNVNDRVKKYLYPSLSQYPFAEIFESSLAEQNQANCPTERSTSVDCEPEKPTVATTTSPPGVASSTINPECEPTVTNQPPSGGSSSSSSSSSQSQPLGPGQASVAASAEHETKAKELHQLVQHLYVAQARVQLEAEEIRKAQAVANSAQQQLEEAANHVRTVTAALQNAQQEVASAAIRAQTAQLQLAAHDQLLFAARQDVDTLSSQMVGLQAAAGITQPRLPFDVAGLLEQLKQPLQDSAKPTPVPPICQAPINRGGGGGGAGVSTGSTGSSADSAAGGAVAGVLSATSRPLASSNANGGLRSAAGNAPEGGLNVGSTRTRASDNVKAATNDSSSAEAATKDSSKNGGAASSDITDEEATLIDMNDDEDVYIYDDDDDSNDSNDNGQIADSEMYNYDVEYYDDT